VTPEEVRKAKANEASARYRASDKGKAARDRYLKTQKSKDRQRRYNNSPSGREATWKYRNMPTPTRPCPAACESCGRPPGLKALALDHDHATGAFRGWLCDRCNRGVGFLGDNVAGVQLALNYLKRSIQ
jgi:hypothetical protein